MLSDLEAFVSEIPSSINPRSVLFQKTDYRKIILSDIGVGAAISLLCRYGLSFGFSSLLKHYFIPYLVRPPAPFN